MTLRRPTDVGTYVGIVLFPVNPLAETYFLHFYAGEYRQVSMKEIGKIQST